MVYTDYIILYYADTLSYMLVCMSWINIYFQQQKSQIAVLVEDYYKFCRWCFLFQIKCIHGMFENYSGPEKPLDGLLLIHSIYAFRADLEGALTQGLSFIKPDGKIIIIINYGKLFLQTGDALNYSVPFEFEWQRISRCLYIKGSIITWLFIMGLSDNNILEITKSHSTEIFLGCPHSLQTNATSLSM